MANMADAIEQYIKTMLAESSDGVVELQRSQLAELFSCAPSQINYVLATRFQLEQGYFVETRRGGGGYVRITVLSFDPSKDWQLMFDTIGESISQARGEAIVARLMREEYVTEREAAMLKAAMGRDVLTVNLPWRDVIRAQVLKAMLIALRKFS